MVEKIIVNPNEIRGYGNIMTTHTSTDYSLEDCTIATGTDTVNGATETVYTLTPTFTPPTPIYLFYDACDSSSGLTNYGTAILLEGGSAPTLSYDSTENAYLLSTPDTKSKCIPINALTDEDNFTWEADVKSTSNIGVGISVSGGTGYGVVAGFHCGGQNVFGWKYTNQSWASFFSDLSGLSNSGYVHIEVTVEGTSLSITCTDANNTSKTRTGTLPTYSTRYVGIGLGANSSNLSAYIKNIKVESL